MNNRSPASVWEEVLARLRPDIGEDNVALWLRPVEPLHLDERLLRVRAPNKFFVERIKEQYERKIEAACRAVTGADISMEYAVAKDVLPLLPMTDPIAEAPPQSEFSFCELIPRYTFSTFVVGASNRFAHATAEAICKNPGKQFNPLFIYGGVGLGKTHLMHAIGHELRRLNARTRVLYTTSERFVNEYINSLRDDKPDAFRSKYRNLDCLLIDDIQFLIAKGRSEEEFFYTFNTLFDSRKQIVISSDRAPKEMAPSEQRLISRLEWGVVADIKPPDLETRIAILRKKAEAEQLFVPDDVILFVASSIKTNIRALEGSLITLAACAYGTGTPLTVDAAKEILKDSLSSEAASPVRVETILRIVAKHFGLDIKDLKSHSRTSGMVFPRHVAMYLTCTLTELSLKEVGSAFGGRDHTTAMHGRDKVKELLEKDLLTVDLVHRLTEQISAVENG